jgi:hypothetical protein
VSSFLHLTTETDSASETLCFLVVSIPADGSPDPQQRCLVRFAYPLRASVLAHCPASTWVRITVPVATLSLIFALRMQRAQQKCLEGARYSRVQERRRDVHRTLGLLQTHVSFLQQNRIRVITCSAERDGSV